MAAPLQQSVVTVQPSPSLPLLTSSNAALLSGCPPGLEYLASMQAIIVQKLFEPLEVYHGIETANKYEIMDSAGRRIFFAAELTHPCILGFAGACRPFVIQLLNSLGAPVLTLIRDCSFGLGCGCMSCRTNEVVVTHIAGEVLGRVKQVCQCCTPRFEIVDVSGQLVFTINGPKGADCCPCMMGPCYNANFPVLLPDGSVEVGIIIKHANELMQRFSDANTFGVTFNIPLMPKLKALILAAVFVIDFGYFESDAGSGRRR